MKSKLVYWLTYAGMWLLALLPFRALYILSDGVCFLMRHVVHYRRKVVRKNLKNSFPEKSEVELREIEREFYRYICDYMLEEIKMMRMSFEDLSRRMEYGNTEEYLAMLEKHGGIVVLIPHYANFEWLTAMGAFMKPEDVPLQVYKPLRNKYMDEMFKIIRARHGGYNVPKHSTAREVIRLRREGKHVVIGLITDQSPNRNEAHHWTTFLNQDTVFMDGGERHVVHYRRKVVRKNLKNSFPEKSEVELREIEREFYRYICDYMLEEIKMMRMSFEDLSRRMEYGNTEEYLAMLEKHGGIVVLIPHYANFEWLTAMGAFMKPEDVPLQVYKPLRNKYMDEMFKIIRARHGGYNVPKHSTAREVIRLRREGKHVVIGLITDQSPNRNEAHHWTTFLNQDTVFMDGGERIARMMNYPVFYCELEKRGRGYCKAYFDLLTETPKQTAEGEITELFVRRLEQTIHRAPAYWFWSHKRWKLTREDLKKQHE